MRLLYGQGGGGAGAAGPPLTLWPEMGLGTPATASFGVPLECVPGLCCLTPALLGVDGNVGPAGFSPFSVPASASGKKSSEVWVGRWQCLDLQSHRSRP